MSAVAGVWSFDDPARARSGCQWLIQSLSIYGRDRSDMSRHGPVALGRCLHVLLPEDRFDHQPVTAENGRFVLVADARIDNRDELAAALGLGSEAAELSDSALLLRGWVAWESGLLRRMIGDFAFALWDSQEELLMLARDTAGERPLHYRRADGFFAFASMPAPLAHLPGQIADIDEERLAAFVADVPPRGRRSFFVDVARLEPGHCLVARRTGMAIHRYWEPSKRTISFRRAEDYGEALREQLDLAVRRRLRRARGEVGSQLSSGFDSSAVTSSAAALLAEAGDRLLAFTAAPRPGFKGPVPNGRIADESEIAAATAALHPNIAHHVVRPDGTSPLALIEGSQRLAGQPIGHVCNNLWWQAINERAASEGVSVMLTGEAGNFTISAGLGMDTLADLAAAGRWVAWWREARGLTGQGGFNWKNVLNASLGPWLPRRLYAALRNQRPDPPIFVGSAWREAMARRLATGGWEMQPARNSRARRRSMLELADPGIFRKRTLAEWRLEERDPTNDRRLVEFCSSLPPEALLSDGLRRPALRHALAGRVPAMVIEQSLRGYQMADWYEQLPAGDAASFARRLANSPAVHAVVDMDALLRAIGQWPAGGWGDRRIVYHYRGQVLRALAGAQFADAVRSGRFG